MKDKESTEQRRASRVCLEKLDQWARLRIQSTLQDLLEAEVTELLGRVTSVRKTTVDPAPGYRNERFQVLPGAGIKKGISDSKHQCAVLIT